MVSQLSTLWRSFRCYQIYGANTNVGKTIISTVLCKALSLNYPTEQSWFLKPVSTGPVDQADGQHVSKFSPKTKTHGLYNFEEAVSPHIAARFRPVSDQKIRDQTICYIQSCAKVGPGNLILETAGGVNSPTPNCTSQGDLYRPLRLPVCLVADSQLGGISSTISAYESLCIRGYDVNVILQFEDLNFQNYDYLRRYFNTRGVPSLVIPPPPPRFPNPEEEYHSMKEYYSKISQLDIVRDTLSMLLEKHRTRVEKLEQMSTEAHSKIWYPFTQHKLISAETIMPIDSASGDFFQAAPSKKFKKVPDNNDSILSPTFDGSASWWTQGVGHGSPSLSLAAAYAAGRYGHVMFAGNIHEPALDLAKTLLKNLKNPRLDKVFFSDNGSTGMEVAMKMALTATSERYQYSQTTTKNLGVIGLKGSYHGDTIGAMDCSEPSIYNKKVHWYQGRGYWFDFPRISMEKGQWYVTLPTSMYETNARVSNSKFSSVDISSQSCKYTETAPRQRFSTLGRIFDLKARKQMDGAELYRKYITETLRHLTHEKGHAFGAVIMEPVLLGAGGMQLIDPLFQHVLVDVVRTSPHLFSHADADSSPSDRTAWSGLPVIFDEVFTGMYRLGRFSAASFLQIDPDISVHAKLLTGGLVPLCCTVASDNIYQAFLSNSKADALLHGHSYTAHPVGCHVANTAVQMLFDLDDTEAWKSGKLDWWCREDWAQNLNDDQIWNSAARPSSVWSVWSHDFLLKLSCSYEAPAIQSVVALGSVLAITMHDIDHSYTSSVSTDLQDYLLRGTRNFMIHVRVLGNVVYVMASQTSEPTTLREIEKLLMAYFKVEID
ncbi:Bifunctional dethiobiotin synthetase/adenosylmethionine-8-amino-7-oxononanoate aminotransferase [Podosphaera aphanis]|nr:Bifunctional dethiobiotin synthetase/adenosylmethionine-8-amino-7-oxononanoate aminotransferase [Podosphaera aphanis]